MKMSREDSLKLVRESALRVLARNGKHAGLNHLYDHLDNEAAHKERGKELARVGLLETVEEVRRFINSIV